MFTSLDEFGAGIPRQSSAFDDQGEVEQGMIYYLKTFKPHLRDISISGPFFPFNTIRNQMIVRLKLEGTKPGISAFIELTARAALVYTQHMTTQLPDGNIMRFQITKEHNAAVASRMPCDTWCVVTSTPVVDNAGNPVRLGATGAQIEKMDTVKTFVTPGEANMAAVLLLDELKVKAGPTARHHQREEGGLVVGAVKPGQGSNEGLQYVMVAHDSGVVHHDAPSSFNITP